jgi:hypothetical protein
MELIFKRNVEGSNPSGRIMKLRETVQAILDEEFAETPAESAARRLFQMGITEADLSEIAKDGFMSFSKDPRFVKTWNILRDIERNQ